jgi:rubrerythrin
MNPFEQKPIKMEDGIMDWTTVYPTPYNKQTVDPYTKVRIILMNGIEVEQTMFKHQFHRNCQNNDLRRELALSRRIEQQQQKHINWLKPIDETQIETTIGYEHVAVDLTAWLAQNEPNAYVKQALDFALLEDFDHLYRYANLLDLDSQIPAQQLVKNYVDITPGRPTIAEHRFPFDSVKNPVDFTTADIRTKLNTLIITAGEQQTMNFYMNLGNTYYNDLGRKLYLEIAMIEEEHVSHYGALLDPRATWLENLLLHEYMECYLYYSFYQDEQDANVKRVWETHFEQEISHLHKAAELLRQYEGKDWQQIIPGGEFPKLLQFHDTRDYVRQILGQQIQLTADRETYTSVFKLPANSSFFFYQNRVNNDVNSVASHNVIAQHQQKFNVDYRAESAPNPVQELCDRTKDNTQIARTPWMLTGAAQPGGAGLGHS